MADYLSNAWRDLLELLKANQQTIFQNPLVWIVFGLVAIGIYGLYDVPKKTSMNSLGNVIRKLLQTLLDTVTDIINALGSLTGFLKVVESLLFGKLNKRTLFVLNNYAIIFLSMASFATTFSGLNIVLNWVLAAFISFGVQVSILVFGINISRNRNAKSLSGRKHKKKRQISNYEENLEESNDNLNEINVKTKEVVRVTYRIFPLSDDYIHKGTLKIRNDEENTYIEKRQAENLDKATEAKKINKHKEKYKSKKAILYFLLVTSLMISSSFSYLFMFDKFVNEQLPYDDHYRSLKIVHGIVRDYSEELSIYEDGLVDILSTYNDKVSEWMRLQESNPLILQEEIEQKRDELETLEAERQDLGEQLLLEDVLDEQRLIESRIETAEDEIEKAEGELKALEFRARDSVYQNQLAAYESILELTSFYANPLYINEVDKNEILARFLVLTQVESQYQNNNEDITQEYQDFEEKQRNQVRDAFDMYYELCEYYAAHNNIGIDFNVVEEQLNIDYQNTDGAEEYQANTNGLLANMLTNINAIPLLSTVISPWTGDRVSMHNQEDYLAKIYNLYRDSSGTVTIFERAFKKLLGLNSEKATLARELALLAISFDLLIVWLTLLRGKKHYVSELGDLRRLVGVLMLDDSLEEANHSFRKSQGFCSVLGIVSGILTFLLYKLNYVAEPASGQDDLFTFLIFCVLGLIVGLLIHKIYIKVFQYKKNWDANNLYLLWKQIWIDSGRNEKELTEHIKHLRESKDYEAVHISMAGIKTLESFCVDVKQQPAFTKYIYQDVLDMFRGIEMMKLYKVIIFKTICKKQLLGVDYVSEQVSMPCIKESIVKDHNLQTQFSILMSRHLIEFNEGYFILTERFWSTLYDAILLCIVGGRISDHDIEEELADNGEDKEELY